MLLVALLSLAGVAVLCLLGIFVIAALIAHRLTIAERLPVSGHPSQLGLSFEDVVFPSRGDRIRLSGWYLPSGDDSRCIILVQGQAHHRNSPGIKPLRLGRDLVDRGFSVLLFDFRGRGESGGTRDTNGDRERRDVFGAIDYVASRGIPTERVGLLGFSLGAAVAVLVAVQEPRIPAIVCDSAYLDSMEIFNGMRFGSFSLPRWSSIPILWVARLLYGTDFSQVRPIKVISDIAPRPIFFIHGGSDQVIPYQQTEALWTASGNASNMLWIVPGARHVHSYSDRPEEYATRVATFFQRHVA